MSEATPNSTPNTGSANGSTPGRPKLGLLEDGSNKAKIFTSEKWSGAMPSGCWSIWNGLLSPTAEELDAFQEADGNGEMADLVISEYKDRLVRVVNDPNNISARNIVRAMQHRVRTHGIGLVGPRFACEVLGQMLIEVGFGGYFWSGRKTTTNSGEILVTGTVDGTDITYNIVETPDTVSFEPFPEGTKTSRTDRICPVGAGNFRL